MQKLITIYKTASLSITYIISLIITFLVFVFIDSLVMHMVFVFINTCIMYYYYKTLDAIFKKRSDATLYYAKRFIVCCSIMFIATWFCISTM